MKNRNERQKKRIGLKRGGLRYVGAVMWIIITCLARHFRRNTSPLFRRRAAAAAVIVGMAAVALFVKASHSSMELAEAHLVLNMSQKGNEVRAGYEHPVVCDLVLENDGGSDLTDVRFYIDGQHEGFSLLLENGGDGESLPPGGKWKVMIIMDPGRKEGEYFVPVVAEAYELEEPVQQVIRFVVKALPEPSGEPERPKPTVKPDVESGQAETQKPDIKPEKPKPTEEPKPAEEPKPTEEPEPAKQPEPSRQPESAEQPGTVLDPETGRKAPVPDTSPEKETGKPAQPEFREKKAGDMAGPEEIIRVDMPAKARLLMNPMTVAENGQISSSRLPITNRSDFPLEVEIRSSVLDIRQNGGPVRKECSLNIDIFHDDKIVVAIRNLKEGENPIHASFSLPPGNAAFMQFFGSLGRGTEYLWRDGDLKAGVVFNFRKSEEKRY